MLKSNNFKNRIGRSSYNFANRVSALCASLRASIWKIKRALSSLVSYAFRCASAHCEQAVLHKTLTFANRTRRSLDKSLYRKITGWSLAMLVVLEAFSYLTFIPDQAFAAYDWETRKLSDIHTMQQMNAKICENTTEIDTQYQLEDTRDGKKYYVAKLQDGNCWMTQNLAYDGAKKDGSTEDIGTSCTLSRTGDSDAQNGATCSSGSWTNSNTDKYFAMGKHTEDNEAAAHASQGNYYNWPAATQGDSGDEVQGVCPPNWQLPTSGNADKTRKSLGGLTAAYGISDSADGSTKLRNKPLYFQYSGSVVSGILSNVDSNGYYWSSIPYNSDGAYILYFYGGPVNPSYGNNRYYGSSIRCVAADIYPEKPSITDNDTANVAITVSPVISIDVTKDANDMTVDFTKVATSTIIARVGSNQPYQVLLSTDKSNLTNPDTDKTIPMIPSEQTIVKGTNSWGIKKLSSPTDTEVNESTTYSPVGVGGQKELFYTSASAVSEDLTFPVAIAVDSSLPTGQYSTQVTLTAVAM